MKNNNKNCNKNNLGIGSSLGTVVGFITALLFSNTMLILICIVLGITYDEIVNKRK